MGKYNSLEVEEVVGFADDGECPAESAAFVERGEMVMSRGLASYLYDRVQYVDQLSPDGEWLHGAVGVT